MEQKNYVTYEQFGAKGNGVTDDMPAIVACHAYANEHGLDVRAQDGAEYYIGGEDLTAYIMTDTDWGKARFIIDDRNVENRQQNCFKAVSAAEKQPLDIQQLRKDQKQLAFPHRGNACVCVMHRGKKVYIRKGLNQDTGFDAFERFLVDGDGNIRNPINWDYETITDAYWVSTDDTPIVIEGGIFTTIANSKPSFYNYYERNLRIQRSHVTVRGLTHYITGEGEQGAPYDGFLSIKEASHVCVEDCLMSAHKIYWTPSQIPGKLVKMGSYDLLVNDSIDVRFRNIRQTTDILDEDYWGIFCSNFCKELHLEGCKISRFDAHCGVTNGSVRGCELGYQGINLIGFGEFVIEDTMVQAAHLVTLRSDYGSFFHGKLTVRNCTWIPRRKTATTLSVIFASNTGDHDFGYPCSMPETVEIDGLTIRDDLLPEEGLRYVVFHHYDQNFTPGKPCPYGTPKRLIANIQRQTGKRMELYQNPELFPYLKSE